MPVNYTHGLSDLSAIHSKMGETLKVGSQAKAMSITELATKLPSQYTPFSPRID